MKKIDNNPNKKTTNTAWRNDINSQNTKQSNLAKENQVNNRTSQPIITWADKGLEVRVGWHEKLLPMPESRTS